MSAETAPSPDTTDTDSTTGPVPALTGFSARTSIVIMTAWVIAWLWQLLRTNARLVTAGTITYTARDLPEDALWRTYDLPNGLTPGHDPLTGTIALTDPSAGLAAWTLLSSAAFVAATVWLWACACRLLLAAERVETTGWIPVLRACRRLRLAPGWLLMTWMSATALTPDPTEQWTTIGTVTTATSLDASLSGLPSPGSVGAVMLASWVCTALIILVHRAVTDNRQLRTQNEALHHETEGLV